MLDELKKERDEAIALAERMERDTERDTSPYWRAAEVASERYADAEEKRIKALPKAERDAENLRKAKEFLHMMAHCADNL